MIELSDSLSLPAELGTQTTLIVGKRGSGKSNTAVVMAEGLFAARVPFVVIDPVDTWWGLKAARNGRDPGLGVHIFGGTHADLPIEPRAAALLADVVVDHRISAVFAVRDFSGADRNRFVTDFARRLLARNREPIHVFLEEAHELAPQTVGESDVKAECVGAVTRLSKLGRSSGIGVSAITQRPASLSKNVTTQAEILIVHRMIGPQDVAAVRQWIKYHGEGEEILGELATLKDGEAFVWAPDFPQGKPVGLKRVRMHQRETFDSAATPRAGERRAEPKILAPVDLEALRDRMAATIERAKGEDPKELRARIAQLERELGAAKGARPVPDLSSLATARAKGAQDATEHVMRARSEEVRRLKKALEAAMKFVIEVNAREFVGGEMTELDKVALQRAIEAAVGVGTKLIDGKLEARALEFARVKHRAEKLLGEMRMLLTDDVQVQVKVTKQEPFTVQPETRRAPQPDGATSGPEQRILDELASLEAFGLSPVVKAQLGLMCGYTNFRSGGFSEPISSLLKAGLLTYPRPGWVQISDEGRSSARPVDRPCTSDELQKRILEKLDGPRARILEALIAIYPESIGKDELGQQLGYTNPRSGGFSEPIGSLKALGLIDYPERGRVMTLPLLFI